MKKKLYVGVLIVSILINCMLTYFLLHAKSPSSVRTTDVQFAFSQLDDNPKSMLLQTIGAAEDQLDIAIYNLDDSEIAAAIIRAKQRGVPVRIITDADKADKKKNGKILDTFIQHDIVVKIVDSQKMHLKMAIVDQTKIVTGSYNYIGMAEGISEESNQPAIMMNYSESQESGTAVYVTDETGQEIIAIAPEKAFQSIVISTPNLQLDQNYTFQSGGVLTGTNNNGVYEQADYTEGSLSVDLPLSLIMTYADENGITEGKTNQMMHGQPPMR